MQCQLRQLEPLPELLRSCELRLEQTTQELNQFKQFHDRDMTLINDLTAKVTVTILIVNYRLSKAVCVLAEIYSGFKCIIKLIDVCC